MANTDEDPMEALVARVMALEAKEDANAAKIQELEAKDDANAAKIQALEAMIRAVGERRERKGVAKESKRTPAEAAADDNTASKVNTKERGVSPSSASKELQDGVKAKELCASAGGLLLLTCATAAAAEVTANVIVPYILMLPGVAVVGELVQSTGLVQAVAPWNLQLRCAAY